MENLLNVNTEVIDNNQSNQAINNEQQNSQSLLNEEQSYWFDDSTKANWEKVPEWFNYKKYKNVSEQAKAYNEAQKLLGGFTGAPEKYEVKIENFQPDEIYTAVESVAKKYNMNNEAFNDIISTFVNKQNEVNIKQNEIQKTNQINEINKLGANGTEIIKNVKQWVENNFSPEEQTIINNMATTAESIKLLNKIKEISGKSLVNNQPILDINNNANINFNDDIDAKLEKMILDPKYSSDAKYFNYVNNLYNEHYGKEQ